MVITVMTIMVPMKIRNKMADDSTKGIVIKGLGKGQES